MGNKMNKDDSEWCERLDDEQFCVLCQCGTEPVFMGKYWNIKILVFQYFFVNAGSVLH